MTKPSKKIKLKVRINKGKRRKSIDERTINGSGFIEHFDEKVESYVDDYVDKVARTKQLTLISGVGFFMLLIISFYVYNFKFQVTNLVSGDENDVGIATRIDLIKEDIGDMVNDYNEIKETINAGIKDARVTEDAATSTPEQEADKKNIIPKPIIENNVASIESLKEKLLEDVKE